MSTAIERKEAAQWLNGQGYSVEIIDRPARREQWYRGDGTPLPNKLPVDNYHLKRFRAKGWTLRAPMVEVAPVVQEVQEPSAAGMPVRPALAKKNKRKSWQKRRVSH